MRGTALLHGISMLMAVASPLGVSPGHADILVGVVVDTSPLIGHPAGPFSLAFQLTDGSGTGDANNTVSIGNVQLDGGSMLNGPVLTGGAAGDLATGATLVDSDFLNELVQQFLPGNTLTFEALLTTNLDLDGIPDQFSFAIKDRSGAEIPTKGSQGVGVDVLLTASIDSARPSIATFAGDPGRAPSAGGDPIPIRAPEVRPVADPPSLMVLGIGAAGLALWTRQRTRCHKRKVRVTRVT